MTRRVRSARATYLDGGARRWSAHSTVSWCRLGVVVRLDTRAGSAAPLLWGAAPAAVSRRKRCPLSLKRSLLRQIAPGAQVGQLPEAGELGVVEADHRHRAALRAHQSFQRCGAGVEHAQGGLRPSLRTPG